MDYLILRGIVTAAADLFNGSAYVAAHVRYTDIIADVKSLVYIYTYYNRYTYMR